MRKWKIKIDAVLDNEEFDTWYGEELIRGALVERFGSDLDAFVDLIDEEE